MATRLRDPVASGDELAYYTCHDPLLQKTYVDRDGLLTNDKFCFIGHGVLKLSWWRSPLGKREWAYQQRRKLLKKQSFSGVYDGTPVENSASDARKKRWASEMGYGLPVPPKVGSGNEEHSNPGGTG